MNQQNKDLNKRSLSFGVNSAFITVVVISIIGVLNFLGNRYPKKLDLTKNKIHTFSDQSTKVVKGLKENLDATFFGDFGAREQFRPIFDNYKSASPKFRLETVDPNKEPIRTKQMGVKKLNTLVLSYKGRTSKVEEITEEKITNALLKLTKEQETVVCTVMGHGEQSFTAATAESFSLVKKGMEDQVYQVKEVTLPQETKIPADCSAVIVMGANKAFFPNEIKALSDYLDQGGRVLVGMEALLAPGADKTTDLKALVKSWGIEIKDALILDPVEHIPNASAALPIVSQFNSDIPVGKEFNQKVIFPVSRPVDTVSPAPEGIKTAWLIKTTAAAWGETNMASVQKGEVKFDAGKDIQGPVSVAAVAFGKKAKSTAAKETRLIVFGSAQFANNNFSRHGGNFDLFMNSVSWAVEDESMISIRAKEDETGIIDLTQNQLQVIFWVCVILVPIFTAILGIVVWVRRKKL